MTCKYARTFSIYSADYKGAIEERFLAKINKQDSCWLFIGANDGNGYGKMGINGHCFRAHVVAYLLYVGDIPAEIDVAHSCNVKNCANPQHLYLATRSENVQHAIRDGLQKCRLTDGQIREIRDWSSKGYSQQAIADFYLIDQQIVSRICRGKAFKWVTSLLIAEGGGG